MTREEAIEFLETLENSEEIKDPMAVLESLRKTRDEAKEKREALEAAEQELESLRGFKSGSRNKAIERELRANGVKNPEKIARLMDVDKIDFADDGGLNGFNEAFELVRTDWPELFDPKRNAPDVDQFKNDTPDTKLSATEMQLKALYEKSGIK